MVQKERLLNWLSLLRDFMEGCTVNGNAGDMKGKVVDFLTEAKKRKDTTCQKTSQPTKPSISISGNSNTIHSGDIHIKMGTMINKIKITKERAEGQDSLVNIEINFCE